MSKVPRILLVTGEPIAIHTVARLVGRAVPGADLVLAPDALAAIRICTTSRIDCLLAEHQMEPIDGLTLVRMLTEQGASPFSLLMCSSPPLEEEVRQAGVARVIVKPVAIETLAQALAPIVGQP